MGRDSKIGWTTHTFNPWIGCQRVSPGCEHCYAEAYDLRYRGGAGWGPKGERRATTDSYWRQPLKWNREAEGAAERPRVFCASLADVFEDRHELLELRAKLFRLIEATPNLDWLLLTKRPENMRRLAELAGWAGEWPRNVWAGTTVEDQRRANERIPILLQVRARVRFLSMEPLLGGVSLTTLDVGETCDVCDEPVLYDAFQRHARCGCTVESPEPVAWSSLDWIIVGGESGGGARDFDLWWARSLVTQAVEHEVPVFVKQLGTRPVESVAPAPENDNRGAVVLVHLNHRKGEEPAEWPPELRRQEFPR